MTSGRYSVQQIITHIYSFAVSQGNHQNFDPSYKIADSKKLGFSKLPILNFFLLKFHGLVWVSRID